ncbi:TatD DNase family Scn1 [Flammula alnicola]|nr:TatD DNase family Scn1 [Flammula alnicola]
MSTSNSSGLPSADVLRHIVDVHCHPTDASGIVSDASMSKLGISICTMSSMESDQDKVKDLASRYPEQVIPCFGYHPWFSHLISTTSSAEDITASSSSSYKEQHYRKLFLQNNNPTEEHVDNDLEEQFQKLIATLPEPRPLSSILAELRANLTAFSTAMLGEVGLDRAFRVPIDYFTSPRILTSFTIPLTHQIAVLQPQMELAVELGRNISIHSVKSQQVTLDLLTAMKRKFSERWNRISVDMHSCGFSAQTWRDAEKKHENVFLSLSTVINHKHGNHRALIAACSPNRILVESDYNDIDMCMSQTWDMVKIVADVKGWPIETEWIDDTHLESEEKWGVVRRLERNWLRFKNGHHPVPQTRKQKRRPDYDSENSDVEKIGDW